MSTARLLIAGTLLCMSGAGLPQSPPVTPSTGRIFQDPPAAVTDDAAAKKTFNESRSNALRTPGDAKAVTPAVDVSTKKTFNESRSNALRTPGDVKAVAPASDASAKKTFNESRSNALRAPGDTKTANGADPSGNKSYYESRSNTANRVTIDANATVPETSLPMNAMPAPSAPR